MANRSKIVTGLSALLLLGAWSTAGAQSLSDLEAAAKKEGKVISLGMPDDWANWGDTWKAMKAKYGVDHTDTDMSSGEAIAKIEAEKANPSADITETLQRALTRAPAQRFEPVVCTDPTGAVVGLVRIEDLASAARSR